MFRASFSSRSGAAALSPLTAVIDDTRLRERSPADAPFGRLPTRDQCVVRPCAFCVDRGEMSDSDRCGLSRLEPMRDHVMDAESAVELLTALGGGGVDVRLCGGWAVDALLGEQTRVHSDLDLWLEATHFEQVGVDRLYPWGDDRLWNFVVHDGARRRVDLHAYERLRDGSIHYGGFQVGDTYPSDALDGRGSINGVHVRCESPAWSLRWRTGYPARPVDFHDVGRLCARFDLELPDGFSSSQGAPPNP